jgi:hypothetical protein
MRGKISIYVPRSDSIAFWWGSPKLLALRLKKILHVDHFAGFANGYKRTVASYKVLLETDATNLAT